jgi:hypothetical protein
VKAICYPADCKFTTKATQWGCSHEDTARKGYVEKMTECHENFHLQACGFIINPEFPHIGASPDGKVSCDCCGVGFVEIKCPYCARDSPLSDFVTYREKLLSAGGLWTIITNGRPLVHVPSTDITAHRWCRLPGLCSLDQ